MPRRNYGMAHPSLVRDAADDLDTRVASLEDRPEPWVKNLSDRIAMLERALAKPGSVIYVQKYEVPFPSADPRINHLCWVWDVERLDARIQRVTEVDFHRDFPFTATDGVRWKHAELVRPEEL